LYTNALSFLLCDSSGLYGERQPIGYRLTVNYGQVRAGYNTLCEPMEELLTRWTAIVGLTLSVLSLALRVIAARHRSRVGAARLFWTAGCVALWLHTACAFQFVHHWSHRAAYESTARQTAELTGLDWAGGLWANYVFLAVWTFDACWWWTRPLSYLTRPRSIECLVQAFLGFIAFNATVVFGTGAARCIGVVGCVALAIVAARMRWARACGTTEG
jgi:hypothetical protein